MSAFCTPLAKGTSLRGDTELDTWAEGVFSRTFGESVPEGLAEACRVARERIAAMDAEARSVCRSFGDDEGKNFSRALAFLQKHGLDPIVWDGDSGVSEFQRLAPMARVLAVSVWIGLQAESPLICRGFVRRWTEQSEVTGFALPNVSNSLGFIAWSFERALSASAGFRYLSAGTCVQLNVGHNDVGGVHRSMVKLATVVLASIAPSEMTESKCGEQQIERSGDPLDLLGTVLPTTDASHLGPTELAAIGRIILPEDFRPSARSGVSVFEDLRAKMKGHLLRNGALAISLGAAIVDKRTPSGRRREELLSRCHPLCRASEQTRAAVFRSKRATGRSNQPVWLRWPDGYRDAHRELASKFPEITVYWR